MRYLAAFGCAALLAGPAEASLIGQTVAIAMQEDGTTYATATGAVPAAGLSYPAGSFSGYTQNAYVTITPTTITFGETNFTIYRGTSFNGPVFTITPAKSLVVTLQSVSGIQGFGAGNVQVTGNQVALNFVGLSAQGPHSVTIAVDPTAGASAIPAPGGAALMGAALLGFGLSRRRG